MSKRLWDVEITAAIPSEGVMVMAFCYPNWPTVRKNWSSDREKLLKFEAEGIEQFIQTVKGQNNSW